MPDQDGFERRDSEVDAALTWLQEAGLAGPAYLLLHGIRPVTFLLGQGLLFLQPLLPLEMWRQAAGRYAGLLADRSRLEAFLASLEVRLRDRAYTRGKENA